MSRYQSDDDGHGGVKIEITRPIFTILAKKYPRFKTFTDEWRYTHSDDPIFIALRYFNRESLEFLYGVLKTSGGGYLASQLKGHMEMLDSPGEPIRRLQYLETALVEYIKTDVIEGWLFVRELDNTAPQPVLVIDVYYTPPVRVKKEYYPPYVTMRTMYWSQGSTQSRSISWYTEEVVGRTVPQILLASGYLKETKALVDAYEKNEARFLEWRQMMGEQFVYTGGFGETEKDRWGGRVVNERKVTGARLVVDDRCDTIDRHHATNLFKPLLDEGTDAAVDDVDDEREYTRMPLSFYVWCFNLRSYTDGYARMDGMAPYVYRPELRDKLILPEAHADLLDALTGSMAVLREDIVEGKSGGTAIMCQGRAGTGKTLTAEVYAEITKRPLYRVHSGQLGVDADTVEKELTKALERSAKWRAIMLIDEADVFMMARGDSLERNAVVGVFLRVLEYYEGVLFLTTNRLDEIDDAILSRCIAQIKYDVPSEAERLRLWATLGGVYKLALVKDKKTLARLAKEFDATGRDIKGLCRLTVKYAAKHKRPPTFDDVRRLSTFKGLTHKASK